MRRLYARLDAELAALGVVCGGCGRCCRFDEVDHVLYASRLERRYLALVSPFFPGSGDHELIARGLRCPYQTETGCRAREGRVLGCRLHYCTWDDPVLEERVYAEWHERLKRMHDELGEPWDYRPLLPLQT